MQSCIHRFPGCLFASVRRGSPVISDKLPCAARDKNAGSPRRGEKRQKWIFSSWQSKWVSYSDGFVFPDGKSRVRAAIYMYICACARICKSPDVARGPWSKKYGEPSWRRDFFLPQTRARARAYVAPITAVGGWRCAFTWPALGFLSLYSCGIVEESAHACGNARGRLLLCAKAIVESGEDKFCYPPGNWGYENDFKNVFRILWSILILFLCGMSEKIL